MVKPLLPGNGQLRAAAARPQSDLSAAGPAQGNGRSHPEEEAVAAAAGRASTSRSESDASQVLAASWQAIAAGTNSVGYWDNRFLQDWVAMGGRRQTAAFATIVFGNLPRPLIDDIADGQFAIVDLGCALGDALPIMHGLFPRSRLAGVDVSPIAVSLAQVLFPQFSFSCFEEFARSTVPVGVIYCSNTLEHFTDWAEKLEALARRATEYVVVAVPFREDARIDEHVASFDADTLPEHLGEAQLVFQTAVETGGEADAAWAGAQLIVVYARQAAAERLVRAGWIGARERAAALAAARLDGVRRRLAEQERVAAEAEAALKTERVSFAARTAEQARLAAGREAVLRTAIGDHADRLARQLRSDADRLAAQARAAAAQQSAADAAVADLLWQLARRGFLAAEREAVLRARAAELASLLPRPERAMRGVRGHAARLLDGRARRAAGALRRGARACAGRDWHQAAMEFRRAVDALPGSPSAWMQLGQSLMQQGDHAAAAAAFGDALLLDDRRPETHLQLGRALAAAGLFSAAIDAYEAARRLQPSDDDATQELEQLYRRMVDEGDRARDAHDWAAAAARYWRALDRTPGLTPIWVQLGHVLKEQGDFSGAEAAYRRALLLDASIADTHLQLGHLLKLQGRRSQAARAYAAAVRLDPALQPAQESLHAVLGYSPGDIERFLAATEPAQDQPNGGGKTAGGLFPGESQAIAVADPAADPQRFGPFFTAALSCVATRYTVIWLSVIDWNYRIQRPQHLASELAAGGSRIFYISLTFDDEDDAGAFRIVGSPRPGVFEVRLRVRSGPGSNIYAGLSLPVVDDLRCALDELIAALSVRRPVVVVDHPSWHPVAFAVPGATVVYDCLDLATGFANAASSLGNAEQMLIAGADVIAAASAPLAEHIAALRGSVVIRNAADVDLFAGGRRGSEADGRPVIGYFGAIAEWFDIGWIEQCAAARPEWEFRLIGRVDGCDVGGAEALSNVRFFGERPYDELPAQLAEFDVAIIPFKMTDLIRCTNPVKLYEYMAAGTPVVSAPLPEVVEATELAYIAEDAGAFERCIAQALAEDCPELRQRRQAWARQHTWGARAGLLAAAVEASLPPVSVIVLTHNGWQLTERCLRSVRLLSDYPALEILVVDNASTDATRQKLSEIAEQDRRIKLIFNDSNLGFAAGNNVGLKAATGKYAILLNNDTVVTRGWVRDLIRPMQIDQRIGLVGPLTSRIGNEQRVAISYDDLGEMASAARQLVRRRLRQTFEVRVLAFFCVALRRAVIDELGLLDEVYGLGFFEDDDYCMRAARAGWKMVVADDVFVHHHHSASFEALGAAAHDLMTRNRQIFESRWGPWQPHRYRDRPGFGEARPAAPA